ncbi:MAG: L-rhamnose isomerase [Bacteroidales bacterium]|jgi:L-rhamnose isomerase|nr:L-rhamnose isomerase [Bacteroidales bacterium]
MKESLIKSAYEAAKEQYAELGVNTEEVLKKMESISLSLHCWQTDDVLGFENPDGGLSGGIATTGNYPGRARTIKEAQDDLVKVTSLLPGKHRVNLHAIYGDFGGKLVDRDQIEPKHFQNWVDWAKANGLKLDFNCTLFSHPKAADGFTLSSKDKAIRDFWIEHVKRCRIISDYMGKELGSTSIHNIWAPDGSKDITVERYDYRKILCESLDAILKTDYAHMKDCIECKLFGLGSEAYVVGSHEFYMGYGISRNKMITLDMGHFHPTESVSDKISSLLLFSDELMFHVSRGIRWDSDHAVIFDDALMSFAQEIVRMDAVNKVHIGLDFFDASINRIGAYVIGSRSTQKAFMFAMLEPLAQLRKYEDSGRYFERLALLEESKMLPWNAVWNYFCMTNNVPSGLECIKDIEKYEADVLSKR